MKRKAFPINVHMTLYYCGFNNHFTILFSLDLGQFLMKYKIIAWI